jgi:hypothetical protein
VCQGAGTFGARYFRTQTIQDTLDPTWGYRCELENKDMDVSMVLGVFDSDVSAAKEAEQVRDLTLTLSLTLTPRGATASSWRTRTWT